VKKRFEFLEAVTRIMDAHFRYFQQVYDIVTYMALSPYVIILHLYWIWTHLLQGYQLLNQMEPFINEVLLRSLFVILTWLLIVVCIVLFTDREMLLVPYFYFNFTSNSTCSSFPQINRCHFVLIFLELKADEERAGWNT